ncbi:MAG: hypothetical protein U9N61_03595 [Euryarchaeota archaeon]|nr:hypothetical protein [Euryarchaeota archaeon]
MRGGITDEPRCHQKVIEDPGITGGEIGYDEYASVRIKILSKKGFDGLRIFMRKP